MSSQEKHTPPARRNKSTQGLSSVGSNSLEVPSEGKGSSSARNSIATSSYESTVSSSQGIQSPESEQVLVKSFRKFAADERSRIQERRRLRAQAEMNSKLQELKQFSKNFRFPTHLPDKMVPSKSGEPQPTPAKPCWLVSHDMALALAKQEESRGNELHGIQQGRSKGRVPWATVIEQSGVASTAFIRLTRSLPYLWRHASPDADTYRVKKACEILVADGGIGLESRNGFARFLGRKEGFTTAVEALRLSWVTVIWEALAYILDDATTLASQPLRTRDLRSYRDDAGILIGDLADNFRMLAIFPRSDVFLDSELAGNIARCYKGVFLFLALLVEAKPTMSPTKFPVTSSTFTSSAFQYLCDVAVDLDWDLQCFLARQDNTQLPASSDGNEALLSRFTGLGSMVKAMRSLSQDLSSPLLPSNTVPIPRDTLINSKEEARIPKLQTLSPKVPEFAFKGRSNTSVNEALGEDTFNNNRTSTEQQVISPMLSGSVPFRRRYSNARSTTPVDAGTASSPIRSFDGQIPPSDPSSLEFRPRWILKGQHYDFEDLQLLPYKPIKVLGLGACALVEMVEDMNTHNLFARKTFRRNQGKLVDVKKRFMDEIRIIERLSEHHHIIKVFSSYTHKRELGLILEPVADSGDLNELIQALRDSEKSLDDNTSSMLVRGFGCLASGLAFMHKQCIRHKDIKPHNILIHQGGFLYTDFGISLDSSLLAGSTTTGNPSAFTRKYCAPEVADWGSRNAMSDIFSLGCVFVDLLSVLNPTLIPDDLLHDCYYERLEPLANALEAGQGSGKYGHVCSITMRMLQYDSKNRVSAARLLQDSIFMGPDQDSSNDIFFCAVCKQDRNLAYKRSAKVFGSIANGGRTQTPHFPEDTSWSPSWSPSMNIATTSSQSGFRHSSPRHDNSQGYPVYQDPPQQTNYPPTAPLPRMVMPCARCKQRKVLTLRYFIKQYGEKHR
ncbi:MAG: hypothetical protein M1812_001549 [Candelaria pacifica]|nr:MAG: hypothetical protein M1812_001549 [Candelaria pacifica]